MLLSELRLMFSLMDRVPDGITPMLQDLEEHIRDQGLADMIQSAETITTVYHSLFLILLHSAGLLIAMIILQFADKHLCEIMN